MTHFGRYRLSFLLSVLVFIVLSSLYLSLPNAKKKLKRAKDSLIKISLITPVKSVPKVIPKAIVPPPKPEVKKPVEKKPVKKKPKVKKPVTKKPVVKKPIIKKVIKPKPKPKKKIIKKVIKPKPKKIEPIIEELPFIEEPIYYEEPQPIIEERLIYTAPPVVTSPPPRRVVIPSPTPTPIMATPPPPVTNSDNGQAKKAFLHNVRNSILVNKKYPKLALRRHIEGATKVRFDILAGGEVTNIRFISGKNIFHKSIRKTLERTFPVAIPANMQGKLPIYDVTVTLHFNIR